jgi:UDP-N-acetylmuramyl pentapeptide synthase
VHETAGSEEAAEVANRIVVPGDLLLVKGSRGMKMEMVVNRLKQDRNLVIQK